MKEGKKKGKKRILFGKGKESWNWGKNWDEGGPKRGDQARSLVKYQAGLGESDGQRQSREGSAGT